MLRKEHFYRAKYTWLTFLLLLAAAIVISVAYSDSGFIIAAIVFAAFITGVSVAMIAATRDR